MDDVTRLKLCTHAPSNFVKRGPVHDLLYYDGSLLSAQMCVAHDSSHVVEIAVDERMAETDGHTIYFRVSKEDLQIMLRVADEEPIDDSRKHCGQSPSGRQDGCPSCHPNPDADPEPS